MFSGNTLVKQTLRVGLLLAAVALGALFVLNIARVLLMIFAGTLIAVFLHGCGAWVHNKANTSYGVGVTLTILAIVALFGLSAWFILPGFESQLKDLQLSIPEAIAKLTSGGQGGFKGFIGHAAAGLQSSRLTSHLSERIVDVVVIVFLSVYLAYQPSTYRNGLLAVVPSRARAGAEDILNRLEKVLWRWFLGRIVGMIAIGILVWIAMASIGLPLAFALGLIAGLFEFVPYLGALVSSVPAVLIALASGTGTAWLVIGLYLIVHGIDGYIVIPLVERRAVHIAPGLTIIVQVAMYFVAGILECWLQIR